MADALGSGPSARKGIGVQIPSPAVLIAYADHKVCVQTKRLSVSRDLTFRFRIRKEKVDISDAESSEIPSPA